MTLRDKCCPKCKAGTGSIYYTYRKRRLWGLVKEHIKCLCSECRYSWKEVIR